MALVLMSVIATAWPAGAAADQASQPASPAAGRLDAGANDTCAVLGGGSVRCWGYGGDGELGYANTSNVGDIQTPASVGPLDFGPGRTVTAISAGSFHTCALLDDGSVLCWGYGANGRLGYGNTSSVNSPASVGAVDLGPGRTAVAISAGGAHTCAILDDGSVLCWGFGFDGQLGYGNNLDFGDTSAPGSHQPVDLGPRHTAKAISAGGLHTCAILGDGTVRCWGFGFLGQLGYGDRNNIGDSSTPTVASVGPVDLGPGRTATAISAGAAHTCAILDDGSVRCWGFGGRGELGYGDANTVGATDLPSSVAPVDLGPGRTATAISAGTDHTCAILDNGSVLCWGNGANGRLGYGSTSNVGDVQTPASVGPVDLGPGRTAVAISAGGAHTCASLDDGSVRCWGDGANGRLGYCSQSNVGDTPSSLPGMFGPVNLVAGDGGVLCAPVNGSLPSISGRAVAGQTLTEAHGSWSPTPTSYGYQWERCDHAGANCATIKGASAQTYKLVAGDVGSTVRVLETASNAGTSSAAASSAATAVVKAAVAANADAARERRWRSCLAKVSAAAKHARALTRRGSKRQRAQARRNLARQLATGRARCVKIWGRTPGRVTRLRAITRGKTKIELDFTAPGTNGRNPPAADSYLVKQSLTPIANQHDFTYAPALCNGACRFGVTQVGTMFKLTVTSLTPRTTYYYAIAALDNVTGRPGPRSHTIKAKTG